MPDQLNTNVLTSPEEASFLDTKIYLENNCIETGIPTKSTHKHQYLHVRSWHPWQCKTAIPYSQALRFKQFCSEWENLLQRSEEPKGHLLKWGYSEQQLEFEIDQAIPTQRESTLLRSNQQKTSRIPLVVTYHPVLPSFRHIGRHYQHIIQSSEHLWEGEPVSANHCLSTSQNLKLFLVHATLPPVPGGVLGSFRCAATRCKTCPILMVTDTLVSSITGKHYILQSLMPLAKHTI